MEHTRPNKINIIKITHKILQAMQVDMAAIIKLRKKGFKCHPGSPKCSLNLIHLNPVKFILGIKDMATKHIKVVLPLHLNSSSNNGIPLDPRVHHILEGLLQMLGHLQLRRNKHTRAILDQVIIKVLNTHNQVTQEIMDLHPVRQYLFKTELMYQHLEFLPANHQEHRLKELVQSDMVSKLAMAIILELKWEDIVMIKLARHTRVTGHHNPNK